MPSGGHTDQTLTLAELEALASLRTSRLLTLNDTCVASKESVILKILLILSVNLYEGACYGKTQSLALACEAAAVEIGLDVVFLHYVKYLQGLFYDVLQYCRREIFSNVFLVYDNLAGAFSEINTCYGTLAATYCINYFHYRFNYLYWLISIALGFWACMLCSVPSKM